MKNIKQKTILYIEDDNNSRLLLKVILEKNNFNILETEDGLAGIEIAKNKKIDLILLDINLPGMNGLEVATRIKSIEECKNIPLVALTSVASTNSRELSLISGCDGFINKPLNPKMIIKKINDYLNGKKEKVEQDKIQELMREYNLKLLSHLEKEIIELKKANDSLNEIDKLRSEFITIVSHEIKTPLASITGFVDLLIKEKFGAVNSEQNEILNIVEKNAKRLDRIVKDMVTISLIDNDISFVKIRKNINIEELIDKAVLYSDSLFKEYQIDVAVFKSKKIPLIDCDEEKIITAINNIIQNSIKYSIDKGKIKIYLNYPSNKAKIKIGLQPKNFIEIIIEDERINISDEQIKKLFKKFGNIEDVEKIHSEEKDLINGEIGLGMTIAKGIIQNHNGYIWAEQNDKNGIQFIILLAIKSNL